MKMKKYLACLMAAVMMCGALAACSSTAEPESDIDAATDAPAEEVTTVEAEEVAAASEVEFEDAVDAQSGDAYLAIVDGQWWIQYWGSSTEDGYMLSYDAGVASITGDGTYTVSVNADTNGFRYDTTGDPNEEYVPGGLSFMAVVIKDGEKVTPNAIITVDKVVVDGNEVALKSKNYTNTEDGAIRTNLLNTYVTTLSGDARSTEGFLFNDQDTSSPALENVDEYSAQVVDPADFASWKKVEVTFTVTGMDGNAVSTNNGDADPAAADTTVAEETIETDAE